MMKEEENASIDRCGLDPVSSGEEVENENEIEVDGGEGKVGQMCLKERKVCSEKQT